MLNVFSCLPDYVSVADVDLFELSLHTVNDVEKVKVALFGLLKQARPSNFPS